jgi:ADP-ribose pyrophosphatase
MLKKWKVINQQDVSPNKWLPVIRHTVELGNKKRIDDFFTSPFGNVAMILPVTKAGEIVLVRQYKHGVGEILLELPAGFQQKGKTIEQTALAELKEETGIKTTSRNLVALGKFCNNPTKTNHVTYGFLAKNLEFNSKQKLDVTEEIELVVVPARKALKMVEKGEIWVADSAAMILKANLLFPELFR